MENLDLGNFGSVLTGEKPVQVTVPEKDLQKLAVYLFGAVFVAMVLANILVKR